MIIKNSTSAFEVSIQLQNQFNILVSTPHPKYSKVRAVNSSNDRVLHKIQGI
uniref:Uncharacterized protein n=1 Tax=Octopus bimaculoides TaxID=37653 RepID=A0A0L8HNU9_OCTBM